MSTTPTPTPIPDHPHLDMSPVLPEKVTVYYPGRRCKGNVDDVVPLWHSVDSPLSDIQFTDPNVDAATKFKGVPSSVLIIHDSCQALMDQGGSVTNGAGLDELTDQIAQDFYDFRSFSADLTYIGMYAVVPTALFDYIEFIYDADEPDNDDYDRIEAIEDRLRPNCITRILSEPWNGEVQEMQHMDPAISQCTDKNNNDVPVEVVPCIIYYSGDTTCTGGGAKADATVSGGAITSVTVTKAGTYTSTPKVAVSGDGTGAKLTATLGSGGVTSVAVDDGGQDYTYAIISFNGGGTHLQLTRMKLCLEDGRLVSTFISYDTVGA
jgi:hypothetical protein